MEPKFLITILIAGCHWALSQVLMHPVLTFIGNQNVLEAQRVPGG